LVAEVGRSMLRPYDHSAITLPLVSIGAAFVVAAPTAHVVV